MDEEDDFISFIPPRKRTKLNVDAEGRSQEALDQILLAFDPLQQKKERPPTVGSHASLADIGLLRRAQQSHNKKRAAQKSAPNEPALKQMKQAKLITPKEREKLDEPNRYYAVEDEVPRPLRFVIGAKASVASMHDDPPPPMMKGQKSSSVSSKDDIIDDFDDYDQEAPLNDSFNEDVRFTEDTRTQAAFAADALLLSEEGKLPRIEVPEKINRLLHPYQRDGVRFLYSLYVEKHGGILADDMGMGKTVQTISFVVAIKGGRAAEPSMFFKTKSSLVLTEPALPLTTKPILVVCPASVLQNWHTEFHRWARLRVFIAHAKDKEAVFQSASQGKLDVVLTSYDTFKQQFTAINEVRWSCVIFDEAHKIKNKSSKLSQICKRLKTVRRFGLTGTVMQNSFEELVRSGLCPLAPTALDRLTRRYNKWNLVDVIWPAYFGNIDYFKKQYINPIRSGAMQDASSGQISLGRVAAQALADKLKKIVLRRTKKHIMHQLPSKEDNVVFCPMTQLQREAYSRVLQSRSYEVLRRNSSVCECDSGKLAARCCKKESLISGDEWRQMVLPAITQLQKLASHLALVNAGDQHAPTELSTYLAKHNNPESAKKPPSEENKAKAKRDEAFRNLAFGEALDAIQRALDEGDDEIISGKMKVLSTLLPAWQAEGSKVLLFSNSTKTLDLLASFLRRHQFSFGRIDGSTPMQQRQRLVDHYNRNRAQFILLMSTKACGLGLNLTSANVVVLWEPSWNVALDLQAMDRAHRIGQQRDCHIYRLISEGTVEEVTYRRQIYKQMLANIAEGKGVNQQSVFKHSELFGSHLLFSLILNQIPAIEMTEHVDAERGITYRIAKSNNNNFDSNAAPDAGSDALLSMILQHARRGQGIDDMLHTPEQLAESTLGQLETDFHYSISDSDDGLFETDH